MEVASTTLRRSLGPERAVLLGGRHLAVERQHLGVEAGQALGGAADLAPAGEEGEHVAVDARASAARMAPAIASGRSRGIGEVAGAVLDPHGKGAALALDHRAVAEEAREGGAVDGGGHGQQAQLRPQRALQVQAEREGEVGVEVALVRLVEQHRRDAFEAGVGLQAADEQAFGDHLDARRGRDGAVEPAWRGRSCRRARPRRAVPPCAGRRRGRRRGGAPAPGCGRRRPRARRAAPAGTRVVLPAPGGATSTAFGAGAQARQERRQRLRHGQVGEHGGAVPSHAARGLSHRRLVACENYGKVAQILLQHALRTCLSGAIPKSTPPGGIYAPASAPRTRRGVRPRPSQPPMRLRRASATCRRRRFSARWQRSSSGRIALVSSFGADSAVLLHLVAAADPAMPVLFLDTGKLFAETLAYCGRLTRRLGLRDLRVVRPDPQGGRGRRSFRRVVERRSGPVLRLAQDGAAASRLGGFRCLDQRPQAPPGFDPRRLADVRER